MYIINMALNIIQETLGNAKDSNKMNLHIEKKETSYFCRHYDYTLRKFMRFE